jgi:hypothetical protein
MDMSKMKTKCFSITAALILGLSAALPAYSAESLLRAPYVFENLGGDDLQFADEYSYGGVSNTPQKSKVIIYGDTFSLSVSGGRGDTEATSYDYLEGGVSFQKSSYGFSLKLGNISEDGGLLGQPIGGKLSSTTKSDTSYARVGGSFGITRDTGIHLGAAMGLSKFEQDGIYISGENIGSTALSVGFSTKRVMSDDDAISISVSGPLSLLDGKVQEKAIGSGGTAPPTNPTDTSGLGLRMAPVDLQMGYERSLSRGKMSLGGTYSIGGDEPEIGARLGVAFQF